MTLFFYYWFWGPYILWTSSLVVVAEICSKVFEDRYDYIQLSCSRDRATNLESVNPVFLRNVCFDHTQPTNALENLRNQT